MSAVHTPVVRAATSSLDDESPWGFDDGLHEVRAVRIRDVNGKPTQFSMVHTRKTGGDEWTPIRPVSDRYKPVNTAEIVQIAMDTIGSKVIEKKVSQRTDRSGARVRWSFPFDAPVEIAKGIFDRNTPWTQHGESTKTDIVFPTFTVDNGYDATISVVVGISFLRLACTNGMMVPVHGAGFKVRAVHTVHEVRRVFEEVKKFDYSRDASLLKRMPQRVLNADELREIAGFLPPKRQAQFEDYVKEMDRHDAWAAYNYISYLQTHEYALSRQNHLNRPLNKLFDFVVN